MNFSELNIAFKNDFESKMTEKFDKTLATCDPRLKDFFGAMQYSIFSGGKRIRPMIMINTYCILGGTNSELIFNFAYALELIHTYSLVHDDLPAMDNDDYRRGKLTSHKKFGEDIAILVGDGLLNMAFETMISSQNIKGVNLELVLKALAEIAQNAGSFGMVGGQALEIMSVQKTEDEVLFIEDLKTSKLFVSSLVCAAILAGSSEEVIAKFRNFGKYIGLAFQIKDDLLDIGTEDKGILTVLKSDDIQSESESKASLLIEKAMNEIKSLDIEQKFFEDLAYFMINRNS